MAVGGMAEVYVAKAKGIGGFEKLVAIKVIHPRFSEDEHFVQMLVEEAKISVQLNHVNIAQTFDLGCIDDTYYIAMEYIEGADTYRLEKRAKDRELALPIDICCYLASEILNGLAYAHRKRDAEGKPLGIVHRDISPQNVLVSYSGEVKLVDFGIAKAALRGGQTEVGVIKGKYYYMSPEQAWGDPVDPRTDVFATGLLLHELLTGEMVYQEDNVPALLDRVRKAEVPSPRDKRPDVPEELAQIVMAAVAKEADDRYASAHAFSQELSRFLYSRNPTFTASRLAQLMGTLFPDEVKRHSQVLKLPTAEEEAAAARALAQKEQAQERAEQAKEREEERARAAARAEASDALRVMSREEFLPRDEQSVIYDLDSVEDMTRNDILPFRRKPSPGPPRGNRPTREIGAPRSREEPTTTAKVVSADDWDDETVLKGKGEWDESTYVEDESDVLDEVQRQLRAGAEEEGEVEEFQGERTVAMVSFPSAAPIAPPKRPSPPSKPAQPSKAPSMPPPARLPPRPAPPNRGRGKAPPPPPGRSVGSRDLQGDLRGEKTVAKPPGPPPVEAEAQELAAERTMALGPDGEIPADLPAEKTVALGQSPPPPRRTRELAKPSKGVRLSADAERFFAPSSSPAGGAPPDPAAASAAGGPGPREAGGPSGAIGAGAGAPAAVVDPFAPPPAGAAGPPPPGGHDPFVARPPPEGASFDALGKPKPVKWIALGVAAVLLLAVGVGLTAWLASGVEPTSLEIMTVPDGATVRIDGRAIDGVTPVTVPDLEPDQSVQVQIEHPGFEPRTEEVPLSEGLNRRVILLNQIRATLHVETDPPGAQVWVDNLLRGSAPLDIPGLAAGQTVTLRSSAPGRETVTRELQIGPDERSPRVTLELPASAED